MAVKQLQAMLKDQTLSKGQRRMLGFIGLVAMIPTAFVIYLLAGFVFALLRSIA